MTLTKAEAKRLNATIAGIARKLEGIEAGQRFLARARLHAAEESLARAKEEHRIAKAIYDNAKRLLPRQRKSSKEG